MTTERERTRFRRLIDLQLRAKGVLDQEAAWLDARNAWEEARDALNKDLRDAIGSEIHTPAGADLLRRLIEGLNG